MGMNIKNERVEELAQELARVTGETMTQAIKVALEERLAKLKQESDYAERKRRVREIVTRFGPVPPGVTSDHSDFYDEYGLPK